MHKSLILAGILVVVAAAVSYPFWPDTVTAGPLGASLLMGGSGVAIIAAGAYAIAK